MIAVQIITLDHCCVIPFLQHVGCHPIAWFMDITGLHQHA